MFGKSDSVLDKLGQQLIQQQAEIESLQNQRADLLRQLHVSQGVIAPLQTQVQQLVNQVDQQQKEIYELQNSTSAQRVHELQKHIEFLNDSARAARAASR